MARRTALLLALLAALLAVGATIPPAGAADAPTLAGSYSGTFTMGKSWVPGGWGAQSGERTFGFGAGCATTAACSVSNLSGGKNTALAFKPGGGGLSYTETVAVDCISNDTGALLTHNGFTYTYTVQFSPAASEIRDGVSYVTKLSGTYRGKIAVTAEGRSDDCLVTGPQTPTATERGTYSLALAPLAAPQALAASAPLAVAGTTSDADARVPAFALPLSDHQRASRGAVADGRRSSVPGSLVTPDDALSSVGGRLTKDLLLLAVLGLLLVFPAQLFNATYEQNHERIDRHLAKAMVWRRRRIQAKVAGTAPATRGRFRRVLVFALCVVVGVLLGGFLDPGYGLDAKSYALTVGVLLSVVVTLVAVVVAVRLYRGVARQDRAWHLEAIPSALLVAGVCLVVSRLTGFQPGYLYGVLAGAVFLVAMDPEREGRAEVTITVVTLLVALGAWFGFAQNAAAANAADPAFPTLTVDAFLAALFVGGLEGLLFGLVPLNILPGGRIKQWSWTAWGVCFLVVGYLFVHVLLAPESGYLGRSTTASVVTTVGMFVVFAVSSVLFWGYFKARPTREAPAEPAPVDVLVPAGAPEVVA